jgi:D-3-phosphoglycerate dehydrogenase
MRVLLADAIEGSTADAVAARGYECVLEPGLSADDLPGRIPGFEALVVRSTKVSGAPTLDPTS